MMRADPVPFRTPGLERSRISGAPLRAHKLAHTAEIRLRVLALHRIRDTSG